jgi:hypothetical protein
VSDQLLELHLEIEFEEDSDAEEKEQATVRLRRRLLDEAEVESVTRAPAGVAPDGARVFDPATIGVLLVKLTGSAAKLKGVISTIAQALPRDRPRTVKIKIDKEVFELSNVSDAQQQQLIDNFIARHAT